MAKSNKKAPAKKPVAKPAKKVVKASTPATKPATAKKIRVAPEGAQPAASSVNKSKYELWDYDTVPARRRGGGGVSPYPFASMPVKKGFTEPLNVDASKYKSEDELNTALKEESNRILNRLSGAVRRFTLKNPQYKFKVRAVEGGVNVYREE
jgi:hypothetical protein